ncbi:MAG TPA: DUF2946 family protein [Burkholderiaceae bacterium]|jgi:hypothetical protein|nr:DUF2946 family protein [Burkholderiaceae bacterium]
MDDIVKAALKKWPSVPHCYDWLALDARGQWFMRDERIQRAGPFPQVKGSVIRHDKLLDFIQRNYEHDEQGCWFFQNGPQRVYVQLEAAPLVWRVSWPGEALRVQAHTGAPADARGCYLDQHGRLFLDSALGFGVVHSQDVLDASRAIEQGVWTPQTLPFEQMPARFGYVLRPEPVAAAHPH